MIGQSRRPRPAPVGSVSAAVLFTALVSAGLLLAGLLLAGRPAVAHADGTVAFTIGDDRITESSGLARDRDRGLYWTVNDSGSGPTVYALDGSGSVTGTVRFRADVTDVEAVQYHDGNLYVADIGDNQARRDFVTVYVLYDTDPVGASVRYRAFDFAYPDGPHDAETLLVDDAGRMSVVTKDSDGAVYRAPADPSRTRVNTLTRVADAPAYVTDGQVLHDGRVALRTYTAVHIVDPTRNFAETARAATPFQPQGESLTENLADDGLLVGSEGQRSAVYAMPVPSGLPSIPAAGATPSTVSTASPAAGAGASGSPPESASGRATASVDPSASASTPAVDGSGAARSGTGSSGTGRSGTGGSGTGGSGTGGSGTGGSGTGIALLLAALVAVAAGLVAFLRSGRRADVAG